MSQKNRETFVPKYPDMKLYEEIIFLDNYFKGKYCVENVLPYYEPLIPAKKRGRHLYWTNFNLPNNLGERKVFKNMIKMKITAQKIISLSVISKHLTGNAYSPIPSGLKMATIQAIKRTRKA